MSHATIEQLEIRRLKTTKSTDDYKPIIYTVSESYNDRRYSKPWIARIVKWELGGYPQLEFGSSDYSSAETYGVAGDIVKCGQKDYRGNKSDNDFYLVDRDLKLIKLTDEQARELFRAI